MLVAQDTTTRVWDIRQPGKSLVVLSGRMGAVRSLRFSSDGRFLAMAEPADFVHVFDVEEGFKRYNILLTPGTTHCDCGLHLPGCLCASWPNSTCFLWYTWVQQLAIALKRLLQPWQH